MLTKEAKPAYKRFASLAWKVTFVAEVIGIAVSYGVYYKLNTDRDFRLYMYRNYDWVLDGYYSVGETLGGQKTRELDLKVWENEGKI